MHGSWRAVAGVRRLEGAVGSHVSGSRQLEVDADDVVACVRRPWHRPLARAAIHIAKCMPLAVLQASQTVCQLAAHTAISGNIYNVLQGTNSMQNQTKAHPYCPQSDSAYQVVDACSEAGHDI